MLRFWYTIQEPIFPDLYNIQNSQIDNYPFIIILNRRYTLDAAKEFVNAIDQDKCPIPYGLSISEWSTINENIRCFDIIKKLRGERSTSPAA
jgi:hypothetical protein